MSWIKLREDLEEDPAVALIAKRCSVSARYTVGTLVRAWSWAGRLSEDGMIPLATPELLDQITGQPGLAKAMVDAGWLIVKETHLEFPKWDRHNSDDAKARALTAERVRRHRATVERDEPVTQDRYQRRGDKRRREEQPPSKEGPPPSAVSFEQKKRPRAKKPTWSGEVPPGLRDPSFLDAWTLWLRFRANERRQPVTQISGDQALLELSSWGVERAVRAIRHTIAKGWQGIREPEALNGVHNGELRTKEQKEGIAHILRLAKDE